MLSGLDLRVVGFWDGDGAEGYCRACAAKRFGGDAVARVGAGLRSYDRYDAEDASRLEPMLRYEAWELARANAYEYARDCDGDHLHVRTRESCGELWCAVSAVVGCVDCGVALSEPIPVPDVVLALPSGAL